MCGIFGYFGDEEAASVVLAGLRRLEYRGYDSWGIAVLGASVGSSMVRVQKQVGTLSNVTPDEHIKGTVGIGHTRWATHGRVSYTNAHPHASSDGSFVLAHNGIVENYQELRAELQAGGEVFVTETDSEVLVILIEKFLREHAAQFPVLPLRFRHAVRETFSRIQGRNGIILLSQHLGNVYAARSGSPLVVGITETAYYLASDTLSFADKTNRVLFIEDSQLVECSVDGLRVYSLSELESIVVQETVLDTADCAVSREGHPHFMLKEIFEQEHTVRNAVQLDAQSVDALAEALIKARTVYTTGAGGALFTAQQIALFLRTIAEIPVHAMPAYEAEGYTHLLKQDDLLIAVSQSGETADTLDTVHQARVRGARIAAVVNMLGSTLARSSDYFIPSRSGPEICVLSTKSASAQMAFGWFLAKVLAGKESEASREIEQLCSFLTTYLRSGIVETAQTLASRIASAGHIFVLGKGRNTHIAQIAGLNIKEASYVHAESFSGGELKHGVIALIEDHVPVICFVDDDEDRAYMLNACAEVKARGAFVIGLSTATNELFDAFLPLPTISGLEAAVVANILPCQLLAYHLAVHKGSNPDRPRNLAKSVTVR